MNKIPHLVKIILYAQIIISSTRDDKLTEKKKN